VHLNKTSKIKSVLLLYLHTSYILDNVNAGDTITFKVHNSKH